MLWVVGEEEGQILVCAGYLDVIECVESDIVIADAHDDRY